MSLRWASWAGVLAAMGRRVLSIVVAVRLTTLRSSSGLGFGVVVAKLRFQLVKAFREVLEKRHAGFGKCVDEQTIARKSRVALESRYKVENVVACWKDSSGTTQVLWARSLDLAC